jgi:ABC-2 type transport system permease protein
VVLLSSAATDFPLSCTVVIKDLKTFFAILGNGRNCSCFGARIVYVYNFSVLPVGGGGPFLQNIIAFFNLALAGFVLASIAVRFVFPALSLEGKPSGSSKARLYCCAAGGGVSSG